MENWTPTGIATKNASRAARPDIDEPGPLTTNEDRIAHPRPISLSRGGSFIPAQRACPRIASGRASGSLSRSAFSWVDRDQIGCALSASVPDFVFALHASGWPWRCG